MKKSELRQMVREILKEELRQGKRLKESRSVADIEAEIARLKQELEDAKIAEKRGALGGKKPAFVYTWDMYTDPAGKGEWTGLDVGVVFETEDDAVDAGYLLLSELDDEGELGYADPDDYNIDIIKVPLSSVSVDILKNSNLAHLI